MPSKKTTKTKQTTKKNGTVPVRKVSNSKSGAGGSVKGGFPGDATFHFKHREMVTTLTSGTSWLCELYPQNAIAFPWLAGIARSFDWYRPNTLTVEYVPTCSGYTAQGAVTLAIDYDCSDELPDSRQALSQTAGAVTRPVYESNRLTADQTSLRLFSHRYTHYDSTTGDPRLAILGNLMVMADSMGDTEVTIGDLYVCYDFTLGAPQPAEEPNYSSQYQNFPYGDGAPAGTLSAEGLWTEGYWNATEAAHGVLGNGARIKRTSVTIHGQRVSVAAVDVDKPGWWQFQFGTSPVDSSNLYHRDTQVAAGSPDVVVQTNALSQTNGINQSWYEQGYYHVASAFRVTCYVSRMARLLSRTAFYLWDAAQAGMSAFGPPTAFAGVGVAGLYLANRPPLLIGNGPQKGVGQLSIVSCSERESAAISKTVTVAASNTTTTQSARTEPGSVLVGASTTATVVGQDVGNRLPTPADYAKATQILCKGKLDDPTAAAFLGHWNRYSSQKNPKGDSGGESWTYTREQVLEFAIAAVKCDRDEPRH